MKVLESKHENDATLKERRYNRSDSRTSYSRDSL